MSLSSSVVSSCLLHMVYVWPGFACPTCITLHFWTLKAMPHLSAHPVSSSSEFIQGSLQPDSVLQSPDWLGNFRIVCKLADNFHCSRTSLQIIYENQEKQWAQHAALRHTRQYCSPSGCLTVEDHSLQSILQPCADPLEDFSSDSMRPDFLQQPLNRYLPYQTP